MGLPESQPGALHSFHSDVTKDERTNRKGIVIAQKRYCMSGFDTKSNITDDWN